MTLSWPPLAAVLSLLAHAAIVLGLCVPATAAHAANASNAAACVRIAQEKDHQSLTNTCDQEIVVVWCHDKDQRGWRDGLCGKGKNFFRMSGTLAPGKSAGNLYSTPLHQAITVGACMGSYRSLRKSDDGSYSCEQPADAFTMTVRGSDRAAACAAADAAAAQTRLASVSGCECRENQRGAICKVTYLAARREPGLVHDLKSELRRILDCDPATETCARAERSRNGGSGKRG